MRSTLTARPRRLLAVAAAAALALVACETDDTVDAPDEGVEDVGPDVEESPETGAPDDELGQFQEEDLELPDPTEHVTDGIFRGLGVVMPAPDGWHLDEMSYMQGMVVAIDEEGAQTFAGQAVDTADLPEDIELDYDQLLADNRDGFAEDPTSDEEIELDGATRAHLVRYDDLPATEEGAAPNTLLTLIAEDGAGQLAMFNYVAPTESFDEDLAEMLQQTAGFDPDSDPQAPMA